MRLGFAICSLAVLSMAYASDQLAPSIDPYLADWDHFATGDKSLAPRIKSGKGEFERLLADALSNHLPSAPSRITFYMLVQVGGSVPVNSALGRAWSKYVGPGFPTTDPDENEQTFFVADFYAWWKAHRDPNQDLPLLQEWLDRDFAKKAVIPMCERLGKYRP
jgi:hypothetical protein